MEASKLVAGYKKVLGEIYNPKKYFERTLTFLSRVPADKHIVHRVEKGDLAAFGRSFLTQTFSRYGFRYLSFLFKAALFYTDNFALAVNIAVKGHHFFTITRLTLATDEFNSYAARVTARFESRLMKKTERGRIIPAYINLCSELAKKQIMRKYRSMTIIVHDLSWYEYQEFIRKIDAVAEAYRLMVAFPV